MSCFFFQVVFSNQKTLFLDNLHFLCLPCSLKGYLTQCVVSNVFRVYHKLKVRVPHYMCNFCLVLYVIDIVQVLLDVQSRQRLGNLLIFCLSVYFLLGLI